MTDDLVGRLKDSVTYEYMPMRVRRAVSEAAARIEALEAALRTFVTEYVQLVESGDSGFWDAEKEPKVITARALLGEAPHAD